MWHDAFPAARLDALARRAAHDRAKVMQRMRDQVEGLVDQATRQCEIGLDAVLAVARRTACRTRHRGRTAATTRARRPNVRTEEWTTLEAEREQALRYLAGAQIKLDAVRVLVAT